MGRPHQLVHCLIPLFYIKPQHIAFVSYGYILSYTFILHQTTTSHFCMTDGTLLSYTFILHQTTTTCQFFFTFKDCLIPLFYIKPQRSVVNCPQLTIVLYLYSTSNHNMADDTARPNGLSYTFILHQTTTRMEFA